MSDKYLNSHFPYVQATGKLTALFEGIQNNDVPEYVDNEFLKKIGVNTSKNDLFLRLLDSLGFTTLGIPTLRYKLYREPGKARSVMHTTLRKVYPAFLKMAEGQSKISPPIREEITHKLWTKYCYSEATSEYIQRTFAKLLSLSSPPEELENSGNVEQHDFTLSNGNKDFSIEVLESKLIKLRPNYDEYIETEKLLFDKLMKVAECHNYKLTKK